jgi:hypothetical protein
MHDIDRTNLESTFGEYAAEFEGEYEGEYSAEYAPGEFGHEFEGDYESPGEFETSEYNQEGTFSEAEEMELAAELLAVSNEAELEQFLGTLFKKAGAFVSSALGKDLTNQLKGLAKKALPMLGSAIGNSIAPGVGGLVGGALASSMGGALGLELEGLSYEDQEFEVAKQIVRLGAAAARNAAQAVEYGPPDQVAHEAFSAAAQQYAPGFSRGRRPRYSSRQCRTCSRSETGRWVRRGNAILLLGV